MELEEAKERLQDLYNENKLTLAVFSKPTKVNALRKVGYLKENEAIETLLQELDRLQKENEELKENIERENKKKAFGTIAEMKLEDLIKNDYISKDKIKDFIVYNKEKITENNKEIEECRKTIMEEQELKRLRLYTLHKDNDLLEREIADLFDLLKEE